jgi:hypothetical protein
MTFKQMPSFCFTRLYVVYSHVHARTYTHHRDLTLVFTFGKVKIITLGYVVRRVVMRSLLSTDLTTLLFFIVVAVFAFSYILLLAERPHVRK